MRPRGASTASVPRTIAAYVVTEASHMQALARNHYYVSPAPCPCDPSPYSNRVVSYTGAYTVSEVSHIHPHHVPVIRPREERQANTP